MGISFSEMCYNKLKEVPAGKVTTYRDLAHAIGTRAYRAVGSAMNKNPYSPEVPCHRVVNSDGKVGGFAGGESAKVEMLRGEGVEVLDGKIKDFKDRLFVFK